MAMAIWEVFFLIHCDLHGDGDLNVEKVMMAGDVDLHGDGDLIVWNLNKIIMNSNTSESESSILS
jgi:hypothetical protein